MEIENAGFRFTVDEKHFENGPFQKRWRHDNHVIFSKHKSKMTGDYAFTNFSDVVWIIISNGNRTEWSPNRSVIIQVITKLDDCAAGVRFVYHEYDYRPNSTTRSLNTN